MGELIIVTCNHCGAEDDFSLGSGMLYSCLENVIDLTKGKTRKALDEIVTHHTVNSANFENALFACPKCNVPKERFFVRVEYDKQKVFETSFRCGKCRTTLIQTDKPIDQFNCRRCGNQTLEKSGGGSWD